MFSRLLLIVALTLPLSACFATAEQIAADDDAACRSAGLKPGTPAYAKCREDRIGDRNMQQMISSLNQSNQFQMMNQATIRSMQH
jgi:hypothetical protein